MVNSSDWRPNVFTNTQRVESAIHDGLLEKDVVLEDGCYIEIAQRLPVRAARSQKGAP
ncbi:MAG: hypothetical protein ACLU7M_03430 [Mediterraneibacter gnavus]